jgi:hypothetical protein
MNTPALPHSITIPVTLRDSLAARLDRYMIAQIGAAIGREFSYELRRRWRHEQRLSNVKNQTSIFLPRVPNKEAFHKT